MSDPQAVLEAERVTVTAGHVRLVEDMSLTVATGEIVGLLGANGAGKSTFLKAASGEIRSHAGTICLNQREVRGLTPAELSVRRAVVAQSSELSFPFTAREVVTLGASVPGFAIPRPDLDAAAADAMAAMGLVHLADRSYLRLSGGERQRVHIARALCQLATAGALRDAPPLLLLDEPTSSLDLAHQRLVLDKIRQLAEGGAAVLAVLHDVNLAAAYCDRLVMMKDGRLLASGRPSAVVASAVLTEGYGCRVDANALPPDSIPFTLPVTRRMRPDAAPGERTGR